MAAAAADLVGGASPAKDPAPKLECVPERMETYGLIFKGKRPAEPALISHFKEPYPEDPAAVATPPKKIALIYNPFSGNGLGHRSLKAVEKVFEKHEIAIELLKTEYENHPFEIASQYDFAGNQIDAVCAIGGDGTFQEVVNGLLGRADFDACPPVGFIRGGTGNSTSASMRLFTAEDGAENICKGVTAAVDVGELVYGPEKKKMWFINNLWWGLGADGAIQAEGMRYLGAARYNVGGLIVILKNRKYGAKLFLDGHETTCPRGELQFMCIQNNQHAGSQFRTCPSAQVDDGVMDCLVTGGQSRGAFLHMFDELKRGGTHIYLTDDVDYRQFKTLRVETTCQMPVVVDGNPVANAMPAEVRVQARRMRIFRGPQCQRDAGASQEALQALLAKEEK